MDQGRSERNHVGVQLALLDDALDRLKNEFDRMTPAETDMAIGDDTKDEEFVGPGWRSSEWMKDPNNESFEIPFRWTIRESSYLNLPCMPRKDYILSLQFVWYFRTRLSIWVNGHRIAYIHGGRYDRKKLEMVVPARVIGDYRICTVRVQNHELHVPALEEPEKSKDPSVLGVMGYGLTWKEKGGSAGTGETPEKK